MGGQREAAGGGWRFSDGAVTLRVSGVKSLRQTLRPGELLTPEETNQTLFKLLVQKPLNTLIVKSMHTEDTSAEKDYSSYFWSYTEVYKL